MVAVSDVWGPYCIRKIGYCSECFRAPKVCQSSKVMKAVPKAMKAVGLSGLALSNFESL